MLHEALARPPQDIDPQRKPRLLSRVTGQAQTNSDPSPAWVELLGFLSCAQRQVPPDCTTYHLVYLLASTKCWLVPNPPWVPGATMILPCMVPLLSAPLRPSVAPHPLLSQSGMGSGDPTCPGVFSPEGSLTLMFSITVQGSWRSLSSHHSPLVEEAFLVDWPCPLSAHRSPRHSYVPLALTLIDHRAFVQAPSSLQHSFQGFLIFESQPIVIFGRPVLNTCQP